MKALVLGALLTFVSSIAFGEVPQNIVLKARFDLESSQAFINQLRIFLHNNNFGDPYAQELKGPVNIDLAKALDELPPDTHRWIRELQSVLRIKPFESNYRLIMERVAYSIKDFNAEFRAGDLRAERVEYVTVNYVNGLHLTADKIIFEVELKQTQSRDPLKFKVELIGPEFIVSPELTAKLPMGWSTSILPNATLLTLGSVDISKIMESIVQRPELIDLTIEDMVMPEVSVTIGHKVISFDEKKIKKFFLERKEEMKKGILDLLNAKMGSKFGNIIKDSPKDLLLPRRGNIAGEINGVFDLQKMTVNKTGILLFELDGYFCKEKGLLSENFCKEEKIEAKVRREIDVASYERSMRKINRSLIEKKTNIALSVSEHYLNQIVEATIRNGLWEGPLRGKDFTLGPEKAFVLAEEAGEDFSLYLDINYKLSATQRILVGRPFLRFPVKLMIALKVEEMHGIPHFTIRVNKAATDEKLVLEGLKEYGLPTTVPEVRFRSKVLRKILEEVGRFQDQTLIDIELQELKGTYLHQLEFFSDGMGRGTATLGFK